MQEKNLFDYAVIRVVPRVEREEFLNIGVIVYCKAEQFLQMIYTMDEKRLLALFPEIDLELVHANLQAMEHICAGTEEGGAIAALDKASRFRWLTATRSTIIQHSHVHPGYTANAQETLNKMFEEMVL